MTEPRYRVPGNQDIEGLGDAARQKAERRVVELEQQLAEQLERERILELEVHSLRRDVDVKASYATAVEAAVDERQRYLDWVQVHFDAERCRADALAEELAAERARTSYRMTQRLIALLRIRRP